MMELITELCTPAIKNLCVFAVALPIYSLFIFVGVKNAKIENVAYGTSVKAALLWFILLIIFLILFDFIHPLVAFILAIFLGVIITRINYSAYGTFVKVAFLWFILLTIFYNRFAGLPPLAAFILSTFILPFVIKRVFKTTYVPACLASVIVLCLQIAILIAMFVTGVGVTHTTDHDGAHTIYLNPI